MLIDVVVGLAVLALLASCILLMKESKTLAILLFPLGIYLLIKHPGLSFYAWPMMALSVLYLLKGFWIVAYKSDNIWLKYQDPGKSKNIFLFWQRANKYEKLGYVLSGILSLFMMIAYYFQAPDEFNVFRQEKMDFFLFNLGYLFFIFMLIFVSYLFSHIILVRMLSPLIVVKTESRTDLVRDVLWIIHHTQKSHTEQMYLVFAGESRSFKSHSLFAKKLRSLIGYTCQYQVETSVLGAEFIRKVPQVVSDRKQVSQAVANEELAKAYRVGQSLRQGR